MRAAETGGLPLRYYGNETAEADEKRGAVEDAEGRIAAQDFSGEEPRNLGADRAVCPICPHACALAEGQTGLCRARVAEGGQVMDANYGHITSLALDPIEKKPLARFRPGSKVLSVGSYGCNEPLVGLEFVRDTGRLAHERGLTNVLVSNGYVNDGPLHEVAPLIDAANIDLKGFTQSFYDLVGGDLDTVKHTIEVLATTPTCHLEVTTLVIPGLNDSDQEIAEAAQWLASLDPSIPYHLTRFFPCHRLTDHPATPPETVHRLADIARRYLKYVYVGNC